MDEEQSKIIKRIQELKNLEEKLDRGFAVISEIIDSLKNGGEVDDIYSITATLYHAFIEEIELRLSNNRENLCVLRGD